MADRLTLAVWAFFGLLALVGIIALILLIARDDPEDIGNGWNGE